MLGVLDRVDGEVDIEIGPTQMLWCRALEVQDRVQRGLSEPRETIEGEKQLAGVEQQPEAVL